MSRIASEQQIKVPPRNNVYTVLAAVGFLVGIIAVIVLISRSQDIMPPGIMK